MLLGMWNEGEKTLAIRRPNGQEYRVRGAAILAGGHKVFGVVTEGNEIHVLTGPRANRQPVRRVRFSDSGMYKGSEGL